MGLSKEWWKEQSDYFELPINDQLDRVRNAGGFIIHAHPFAEAPWIECIRLFPRKEDAVEIFNGGCGREINERAYMYAESYGLLMTGGTDTHSGHEKNFCGIETDTECYNVHDIVDAIREKRAHPFSQMHQDILK